MAHKKHHKKADGGHVKGEKAKEHLYNAVGSPEAKEAHDEKDSFRRGGKKRATGGAVHGQKAARTLDKRARGGGVKSPFTEAYHSTLPAKQNTGKGSGHEDEQPGDMDS